MSKCIDCLHYNICTFGKCDIISGCPFYTKRSEWVHLPCEVGDTVWYITGIGHNLIKLAIVKEIIMDSKGIKDLYVLGNGFNFTNSFDIFYLTHKEAEKALEEKKC